MMEPFQAWYLPAGFSLQDGEVGQLDGSAGSVGQYAVLPEARLLELLAILRGERDRTLVSIPVARIVRGVDSVARRFLDPGDEIRAAVLEGLRIQAGYSAPMAVEVLEGMARGWVEVALLGLLRSEFPDPSVLDGFCRGPAGGWVRALGFPLTFHLGAGSVPGVATTSMIRGLLVKSAILLKPGLGDLSLPVVFARALEEEDPDLTRSLGVLYWPVTESGRTETTLRHVDLVVAYGSDGTVRWVRERLPAHILLRGYRHRMGFGLVGRGALRRSGGLGSAPAPTTAREERGGAEATARDAARSVALFDQKGCVSPHVLFVERGGEVDAEDWANLLAGALEEMESILPSGEVSLEDGVAIQQLRGVTELQDGLGEGVTRHGGGGAPWTVVFRGGGVVEASCLNRTVRVLAVDDLRESLPALKDWVPFLQTVGVAGMEGRMPEMVEALSRLGVSRISPLAKVPWPDPWWHHDGFGPLVELVRWTDVEGEEGISPETAEW